MHERSIRKYLKCLRHIWVQTRVCFGKHPSSTGPQTLIFFPFLGSAILNCGFTGIVYYKKGEDERHTPDLSGIESRIENLLSMGYEFCARNSHPAHTHYLGGNDAIAGVSGAVLALKGKKPFLELINDFEAQERIKRLEKTIQDVILKETSLLQVHMGRLAAADVDTISRRLETLKDIRWALLSELLGNMEKIRALSSVPEPVLHHQAAVCLKNLNAVFNSIDRLEVRGRDSAGISLLFIIDDAADADFYRALGASGLEAAFFDRCGHQILSNLSIRYRKMQADGTACRVSIALTYKIAAEIGRLGDNVAFLREQIRQDRILQLLISLPHQYHTVCAHTRWASVGDINEANCHPLDNITSVSSDADATIHVCLNGDIDNFQSLKEKYRQNGLVFPDEITGDTKIIPVHIQHYVKQGHPIEEAFRLAVNDFDGSHAISMHTDLAPGKLFLALKGSGQAIFVGLAKDHYIPTSELYGLVEETSQYIKMDGEKIHTDAAGNAVRGQIFVIDQNCSGSLEGIRAAWYNGTPLPLSRDDLRETPLTARDIDRQNFDHYFLKEISESPASVSKTLQNRWKIIEDGELRYAVTLDDKMVPEKIRETFCAGKIRRILLIGQGTAGVAAQACGDIMRYYLNDPAVVIQSLKSSELSGFVMDPNGTGDMSDTLLIPISQSGTTTDTNKTVDMVKKRGAFSIAIVNRRDSDLTFKVDGVIYTSSGRDIEMSVASTKAFYSQIIAGAVLGLFFAQLTGRRNQGFISNEIKTMIELPGHMETVLAGKRQIKESAFRHAVARTYWAAVGSGPNKAAADEIRIKLSELCYKTISSDYVEDKKHIDLSSEPLIFVCAAGTRRSVIGDIIKDTAIFKSHKALPIVIADEHEHRFAPYAADVIHVPAVSEHFAPILNTLVGHLWGYYAALAINEGSRFLYDFRTDINQLIQENTEKNMDIFEIALEESFREKIIRFYRELRQQQDENRLSATIGIRGATHLILLLKYLAGRLPVADFELDFGIKGTATNMFTRFFEALGEAINCLARPVDAIKHQAKTVTVGTSRIEEKIEGPLFDAVAEYGFHIDQLTISNIMVLKNLQRIIADLKGATLYHIAGINLLGEPTDDTVIEVVRKTGTSAAMSSRAEQDRTLKGTKKIIVRRGNVYIGKGRKDDRSILVIPLISDDPDRPNTIEHLLLLDIAFNEAVSLEAKVKALGGKHEHIKNLVQETNITWNDNLLERVNMRDLFGLSAEKIAETIVAVN